MYCPTCGKQIPDGSAFCLHCGAQIAALSGSIDRSVVAKWAQQDFVYRYPPGCMWALVGSSGYSEAGAKIEFWQNSQREIRLELQKWLDNGWEPIGEIGPASIRIRTFRSAKYSAFGWLWIAILSLLMLGLPLLFIWSTYAEPVEVRIAMRRPSTGDLPDETEN